MANNQILAAYIAANDNAEERAPGAKQIPYGDMIVVHDNKANSYSLVKVNNEGNVVGEAITLDQENPFVVNPENKRIVCYHAYDAEKQVTYALDCQGNQLTQAQTLYLQNITGAKSPFSEIAKLQSYECGDAVEKSKTLADVVASIGEYSPKTSEEFEVLGNFVQGLLGGQVLHTPATAEMVNAIVKSLTKIKNQVLGLEAAEKEKEARLNESLANLDSMLHGSNDEE